MSTVASHRALLKPRTSPLVHMLAGYGLASLIFDIAKLVTR